MMSNELLSAFLPIDRKQFQYDTFDGELEKITELLKEFGIKVTYTDTGTASVLGFYWSEEEVNSKRTRSAGAKAKSINCTRRHVRELINELGAANAATKIGMTKSGMYARMKRNKQEDERLGLTDTDDLKF